MAHPARLIWALLLVAAALASFRPARGWPARPDPRAAPATAALLGLACALAAAWSPS
jgi:hypothetical protein